MKKEDEEGKGAKKTDDPEVNSSFVSILHILFTAVTSF